MDPATMAFRDSHALHRWARRQRAAAIASAIAATAKAAARGSVACLAMLMRWRNGPGGGWMLAGGKEAEHDPFPSASTRYGAAHRA